MACGDKPTRHRDAAEAVSEEGSRGHDALADSATPEQIFLKQFFSIPSIQARLDEKNASRLRPGRPGQPQSISSLMRRWLAVRGAKEPAAKIADEVAPFFDFGAFGEHLPLLGSAQGATDRGFRGLT